MGPGRCSHQTQSTSTKCCLTLPAIVTTTQCHRSTPQHGATLCCPLAMQTAPPCNPLPLNRYRLQDGTTLQELCMVRLHGYCQCQLPVTQVFSAQLVRLATVSCRCRLSAVAATVTGTAGVLRLRHLLPHGHTIRLPLHSDEGQEGQMLAGMTRLAACPSKTLQHLPIVKPSSA